MYLLLVGDAIMPLFTAHANTTNTTTKNCIFFLFIVLLSSYFKRNNIFYTIAAVGARGT